MAKTDPAVELPKPSEFLKIRAGCLEGAAVLTKIGEPPEMVRQLRSPANSVLIHRKFQGELSPLPDCLPGRGKTRD